MKLTTVLLLVFCMQIYATGYTQKITLAEKNTSLEKIFQQIKKQSSYTFWYEDKLVKDINPISITIQGATLAQTLNQVLATFPLTYEIIGKTIVIKKKAIVLAVAPSSIITITGQVTNIKGELLPGVSVVVKGSLQGAITDMDGKYKLQVAPSDKIITFSCIGMKKQEIAINGRTIINVCWNKMFQHWTL